MLSQFGIFTVRENSDEAAITWKSQQIYIFLEGIFHAFSKWLLDAAEKKKKKMCSWITKLLRFIEIHQIEGMQKISVAYNLLFLLQNDIAIQL